VAQRSFLIKGVDGWCPLCGGAFALAAAGLLSKMMGAPLTGVPLSYLLGAEGIGLYQWPIHFFNIAFVVLVSGYSPGRRQAEAPRKWPGGDTVRPGKFSGLP